MTERLVHRSFLLASLTLFLWMFLSSDALDQVADMGAIAAGSPEAAAIGHSFAAKWRHGMAGGSPLYMPGFFATAVALWFWALNRKAGRLLLEGLALILISALVAVILARPGSQVVLAAFTRETGMELAQVPTTPRGSSFALAFLTLVSWAAFILASQRALLKRSLIPFLVPAAFAVVLAIARTVTIDDAFGIWSRRALDGNLVAIFSFALIPALACIMARYASTDPVSVEP